MHHMGTKTISLKDEAYNRLRAARRYSDESFSEVILRATWPEDTTTAGALLEGMRARWTHLEPDEVERVAAARNAAAPPEDKWADR